MCTDTTRWSLVGKITWKSSIGTGMGKRPNWECLFVHRNQQLFLSENVDHIKVAGKKQNMAPMWKKLLKNVDLDQPTTIPDHVYLGCSQREGKPNENIVDAGATEKLPKWEKLHATTVAGSYDMEGHAKKCVEKYCELANRQSSGTKSSPFAWMTIISSRKNWNRLEN